MACVMIPFWSWRPIATKSTAIAVPTVSRKGIGQHRILRRFLHQPLHPILHPPQYPNRILHRSLHPRRDPSPRAPPRFKALGLVLRKELEFGSLLPIAIHSEMIGLDYMTPTRIPRCDPFFGTGPVEHKNALERYQKGVCIWGPLRKELEIGLWDEEITSFGSFAGESQVDPIRSWQKVRLLPFPIVVKSSLENDECIYILL
jgi:hypothetical protein